MDNITLTELLNLNRDQGKWMYTRDLLKNAADKYNLDPNLLYALAAQESGWNQGAKSKRGAVGILQVKPSLGKQYGLDVSLLPDNIEAGTRYLSELMQRRGTLRRALEAYNAGPTRALQREQPGRRMPRETRKYVPSVMGLMDALTTYSASPEDYTNKLLRYLEQ